MGSEAVHYRGLAEASDAVKKLVKQLGLSTPAVLVEELLQAHALEVTSMSGKDQSSLAAYPI